MVRCRKPPAKLGRDQQRCCWHLILVAKPEFLSQERLEFDVYMKPAERGALAVQCRACSDQMVIRPMAMSSSGRANLMVTRMNSLVTRPMGQGVSGSMPYPTRSYQVLPLEMIGSTCSLEILINLEDLARICHSLPPNSCWLNAHSIFFLQVESRLNPYGPIAGTRAAWHGETMWDRCDVSGQAEVGMSQFYPQLGKNIGIHWWRWSFNI